MEERIKKAVFLNKNNLILSTKYEWLIDIDIDAEASGANICNVKN